MDDLPAIVVSDCDAKMKSLGSVDFLDSTEDFDVVESSGRLAGIHTIDADFAKVYSDSEAYESRIIEGAHALIHGQGAEVIVLCGAQTAGVTGRIQDRVPVPMLDGVVCGTLQAEAMARLRAAKPTTGSYSALTSAQLSSISPGLKSLLGRGRS